MDNEEIAEAITKMSSTSSKVLNEVKLGQKNLHSRLDEIEKRNNRQRLMGGGVPIDRSDDPDIVLAKQDFNAYARGDFKAMVAGSDPQSGYFIPDILQSSIIEKLYDPPALLRAVRMEQFDGAGSEWIEPMRKTLVTARRRGGELEAAQDTGAANPAALLTVPAGESEALITISQKLLDDSDRDLSEMSINDMLAAFDRQLDAEIVSGTGVGSQALGFLSVSAVTTSDATRGWGSVQYFPSGAATAITADALKDVVYGLRAPYRGGAAWAMSSNTANAVDKLKNGVGDYLWRDSMTAGVPPSLLGFPVIFDENMPSVGAGAYPLAFANWRLAYVAVRKKQTRVLRDVFSSKPNLQLYSYRRQGGSLANSEAIKLLKIATS